MSKSSLLVYFHETNIYSSKDIMTDQVVFRSVFGHRKIERSVLKEYGDQNTGQFLFGLNLILSWLRVVVTSTQERKRLRNVYKTHHPYWSIKSITRHTQVGTLTCHIGLFRVQTKTQISGRGTVSYDVREDDRVELDNLQVRKKNEYDDIRY